MLFSTAVGSEEDKGSKHNSIFLLQFAPKICIPGSSPNRGELEEQSECAEMLSALLPGHPTFPRFLLWAEGRVAGGRNPNALFCSTEGLKGDLLAKPCQGDNWTTGFLRRVSTVPKAQPVFIVSL